MGRPRTTEPSNGTHVLGWQHVPVKSQMPFDGSTQFERVSITSSAHRATQTTNAVHRGAQNRDRGPRLCTPLFVWTRVTGGRETFSGTPPGVQRTTHNCTEPHVTGVRENLNTGMVRATSSQTPEMVPSLQACQVARASSQVEL